MRRMVGVGVDRYKVGNIQGQKSPSIDNREWLV